MKECTQCKQTKEFLEFYKTSDNSGDGFRSKCKDCCRNRQSKYRTNNKEKVREYRIKYCKKNRERIKEYHKKWKKERYGEFVPLTPEEKKERRRKRDIEYRNSFPEKKMARNAVATIKVEKGFSKHHWSYLEENHKDIIVLSNKFHSFIHKYMSYCKNNKCFISEKGVLLDTKQKHLEYIHSLNY